MDDRPSAARTYTLLTIGEGLVAQIPALVISTAAGIVVTRVAAEDEGAHLGPRDRRAGAGAAASALAVAAALAGAAGPRAGAAGDAVPGAGGGAGRARLAPHLRRPASTDERSRRRTLPPAGAAADARLPAPRLTPLAVELSPELAAELRAASADGAFAGDALDAARARLFEEAGLTLPPVRLRAADAARRPARPQLPHPLQRDSARARRSAARPRRGAAEIAADLVRLMRRRGHELLGIQETQALLTALEPSHPALVREVVPKVVSPAQLADVLRRLAAEGISLRQLPEILGAIADAPAAARDPATLAERARAALRGAITFAHAGAAGRAGGDRARPAGRGDAARSNPPRRRWRAPGAGAASVARHPGRRRPRAGRRCAALPRAAGGRARGAVIVTAADLRRHVRRLVEVAHPDLAVLSYAELAPETEIDTVARVSVA